MEKEKSLSKKELWFVAIYMSIGYLVIAYSVELMNYGISKWPTCISQNTPQCNPNRNKYPTEDILPVL